MIGKMLLVFVIAFSFIVAPVAAQRTGQEPAAVEGTWILVTSELGGKKLPDEGLKDSRLILTGGRYSFQNDYGTYKVALPEQAGSPTPMDIVGTDGPNKGKTILAIYELSGDTLRICYDLGGKQRPSEFTTHAGTSQFLVLYKRAKD